MREAADGADAATIDARLGDVQGLSRQEDEKQAEFKRSFYFDAALDEHEVEAGVGERLDGLPVRTIVSREQTGRGLLDVLPRGVAKDTAVRWLVDRFGLAPDDVLFAGDSGNDLVALLAGWNAVLVGNAADAVRRRVRDEAKRRGLTDRVLLAEGPVVRGVLEGCAHFGLCHR
jgi:HAD superfamily hydrolase (TIGR01484 family)